MKEIADIVIVGGGAAGLMAAYGAASSLHGSGRVVVLEKMPRPARKIMITGKGRCNFTNLKDWNEFQQRVHPKANFLKPSFFNLTPAKLIEFFTDHGMPSVVERGDRAFPASHLASDVIDTLVCAAKESGAEILCGETVTGCRASGDGFSVESNGREWPCRKLIIATGGLSYPKTGSTGDGYAWAQGFGHSLTPRFPSLTALVPRDYRNTDLIQLKNVQLTLFVDGNEAQSDFGDLDFTNGGIEGPLGFRLSRKCVKALTNGSRVFVTIDLKPAVGEEELESRVKCLWDEICRDRRSEGKPYKTRFAVLLGKMLPRELIPLFSQYNPDCDHKRLSHTLKNWKMEITGNVGYERCVVTAGGVELSELTPKTLESRLVPGLYLCGEVLDLDADTGGYNLHIAFSTGCLAGQCAAMNIKNFQK